MFCFIFALLRLSPENIITSNEPAAATQKGLRLTFKYMDPVREVNAHSYARVVGVHGGRKDKGHFF